MFGQIWPQIKAMNCWSSVTWPRLDDQQTLAVLAEEAALPIYQIETLITPTALIGTDLGRTALIIVSLRLLVTPHAKDGQCSAGSHLLPFCTPFTS